MPNLQTKVVPMKRKSQSQKEVTQFNELCDENIDFSQFQNYNTKLSYQHNKISPSFQQQQPIIQTGAYPGQHPENFNYNNNNNNNYNNYKNNQQFYYPNYNSYNYNVNNHQFNNNNNFNHPNPMPINSNMEFNSYNNKNNFLSSNIFVPNNNYNNNGNFSPVGYNNSNFSSFPNNNLNLNHYNNNYVDLSNVSNNMSSMSIQNSESSNNQILDGKNSVNHDGIYNFDNNNDSLNNCAKNSLDESKNIFTIRAPPKKTLSDSNLKSTIKNRAEIPIKSLFKEKIESNNEDINLEEMLANLTLDLPEFIKTQKGSRIMQKELNNILPENLEVLLLRLCSGLTGIMVDTYGNYFSQKLIQCCSGQQRLLILKSVGHNIYLDCQGFCDDFLP